MGNFNRDNNSGGRSFQKRSFGGGRDGGRPEMHKAICSKCGKDCELPFRPTGERPVFCRDCFSKNDRDDSRGGSRRDDRGGARPSFNKFENRGSSPSNEQLDAINSKLDKILKLLNPNVESNQSTRKEIVSEIPEDLPKKIAKKKLTKKATKVSIESTTEPAAAEVIEPETPSETPTE